MNVTHLECALCGLRHEARQLQNLCNECGKPLFVRYDLAKAGETLTRESLKTRESSLWRYREVCRSRTLKMWCHSAKAGRHCFGRIELPLLSVFLSSYSSKTKGRIRRRVLRHAE